MSEKVTPITEAPSALGQSPKEYFAEDSEQAFDAFARAADQHKTAKGEVPVGDPAQIRAELAPNQGVARPVISGAQQAHEGVHGFPAKDEHLGPIR